VIFCNKAKINYMPRKQNSDKDREKINSAAEADQKLDEMRRATEKRTRKPGSQSNQSDRHNTGRGGGK
jgi:hypothetical protein